MTWWRRVGRMGRGAASAGPVRTPEPARAAGRRTWRVTGASALGASHAHKGLPNQDALGWTPRGNPGLPIIVAIADGHGSARSSRSAAGARFAVEAALDALMTTAPAATAGGSLDDLRRLIAEAAPRALCAAWQQRVSADMLADPLPPTAAAEPLLAYGSTVSAAALTAEIAVFLQLGDGALLAVDEAGRAWRPLPPDRRLIGDETTSLCLPEAWRDVRLAVEPLTDAAPALILLATDGYTNSFKDDAAFVQVGGDLLRLIQEHGCEAIAARLPDWLAEASRLGSGDDATLALAWRPRLQALAPFATPATQGAPPCA